MKDTFGLNNYAFSRSKWMLLAAGAIMVGLGLALSLAAPGTASDSNDLATAASSPGSRASSGGGLLGQSFAESRPAGDSSNPSSPGESSVNARDFSAFLVKGGFGVFVGFAIGFAIRSFVRLAIVMIGFYLLVLTLMAYAGWVEIHWTAMQEQFNHSATTLGEQFTSFQQFLTGMIPSAGMAAVGLTFGLRRR